MKKLLSMVLALCMLVTSMSLVATAANEGLTIFKQTKMLELSKTATAIWEIPLKAGKTTTFGCWPQGSVEYETETNVSGGTFTSLKIPDTLDWFIGSDKEADNFYSIMNNQKETYEFWFKTDKLDSNNSNRQNLFYTGTGYYYHKHFSDSVKQSLYIQNGKLIYGTGNHVIASMSLSKMQSKYIHALLVRENNAETGKLKYVAYFNGEKAGEYEVDGNTTTPDGTRVFFGGSYKYDASDVVTADMRFKGNFAEFNVYQDVATDSIAKSLYEEKADTYKLPAVFENEKAVEFNKNVTNFSELFVEPGFTKALSNWSHGTMSIVSETNKSDNKFKSVKIDDTSDNFICADDPDKQTLYGKVVNNLKTSYEFWLKTDKLGEKDTKQPIFYTGSGWHIHDNYPRDIKQALYIQNGKLIYDIYDNEQKVVGEMSLAGKKGKYIHVMLTREAKTTDNTITYKAYFDGVLAGEKVKTVTADTIAYPDGTANKSHLYFGGVWADGTATAPDMRFKGNVAEFNIYHEIATQNDVTKLYNGKKDTYDIEVIEEVVEPIVAFKKAKKLELNKNATSVDTLPVTPGTTSAIGCWPTGTLKLDNETSVSGETFKSVNISKDNDWFIGGDENSKSAFWKTNLNHEKTTWEFWLKTDDIDRGNKWRKNIFYIGTGYTYTYYFVRDARLSLYVQDGKLVFGRNDKDIATVDLGAYQSKYVHAILSREFDETNGTVKYVAYFNGNKVGEFTNNVTSFVDDPDGDKVFFGGAYANGTGIASNQRFNGNIAEFNVYHDVVTDEIAKSLYEENKNTYLLYTTFEDCSLYDGDALKDNTVTFNFSTPMDEETFNDGIEVKTGDNILIYNTDYTAKADGKNIVLTIKNIDVTKKYTVSLNDNLRAYDGAKVKFEEVPFTLTYEPLNNTIESVKKQLANITDFSKNNLKELKAFKEKILPLEKIGIDFKGETYYSNYCDIRENLTKIEDITHSYSDDKLYINLTFEYPVGESYIEKIKYFEGRKDAEFDIQAVKNSENKIIGAKITADNAYKSSEYVQVTVDNGWLGQETKNFYIPTAVEIGKVIIKDNQNNIKASLSEITDGIANVSISAVNNSFANGITGDFVFTVKDTTGMLVDIRTIPKTLEKGETQNVSVKFENIPANAKDYEIEVYFWNGVSAMKPHTEKTDFTKTYGLDNVNDTTKDLKVVAIGGSITEGGNITTPFIKSWDDSREGKINFVNAGIGGTQSNYGSLRLKDDVLSHKPDVVIVEFILNDTGDQTCAWNVENIIRTCYEAEHQPVVMFLYVPDIRKSGANYRQAENFSRYKKVLDAYGLTPLNAHQMAVDTVNAGTSWDTYVSSSDVHPNATQGANIASLMWNELSVNMSKYMKNIEYTDKMYYRDDVENGTRVSASMTSYDENWAEKTPDNLVTEGYGNAATMRSQKYVATKTAGAKMSFEFSGTKLILTTIVGKTGRSADYVIKGENGNIEATGTLSNYVNLNPFENLMFDLNATSGDQYMELNLKNGIHTIEITVLDSDNSNSEFGIADILIDEN